MLTVSLSALIGLYFGASLIRRLIKKTGYTARWIGYYFPHQDGA